MIELDKLFEYLRYDKDTGVVSWIKDKGQAKVGKQIHLGYYDDLELASLVRKEAERIYYGEYARSY